MRQRRGGGENPTPHETLISNIATSLIGWFQRPLGFGLVKGFLWVVNHAVMYIWFMGFPMLIIFIYILGTDGLGIGQYFYSYIFI